METPSQILRRHGLKPKHSWGQNFLADEQVLARIAEAAVADGQLPVVELGPGLGHLTRSLLQAGGRVTGIERDEDMVQVLTRELQHPSFRLVPANAATVRFAEAAGAPAVCVAGNIPYHLTSSILFSVLDQRASVERVVLTIQREVADRLCSQPGGRQYGILPALLGLYFRLDYLQTVPARLFHPPPKVDSAVIRMVRLQQPRALVNRHSRFVRVVKAAFAQRRKTLLNSLRSDAALGSREEIVHALSISGVDPSRRAETLSPEEFAAIERALPVQASEDPPAEASGEP